MQTFINKPDITMYPGIIVHEDTTLEFQNDYVEQTLENLTFKSITRIKGEGFESEYRTTIHLNEGDILIYDGEGRGYIKPVETFMTVSEAIEELEHIKEL